MADPQSERVAIAAHLHVLLRRHQGRVTDVEWMARNREYALAVAELARGAEQAELRQLGQRLVALLTPPAPAPAPARTATPAVNSALADQARRYVGGVRW